MQTISISKLGAALKAALRNLLKIVFQTLFQPKELENYLRQTPKVRKRLILGHLALLLINGSIVYLVYVFWLGTLISSMNRSATNIKLTESSDIIFTIVFVTGVTIIMPLIIAYFWGILFKRDYTLTLLVCTYWAIITSISGITIDYFGRFFFPLELEDIISIGAIILSGIVLGMGIVNLYGKTTGLKPAFFVMGILSFCWVIYLIIEENYSISFLIFFQLWLGTTLHFGIGLYRIPVYLVEFVFQFLSLRIISTGSKNLVKAIRISPLFFDHISTLPLPFTKTLLQQIAEKDKKLYADQLVYLLEKTNQQKIAIKSFYEFHRKYREYLFETLYRDLQTEDRKLLGTLTKKLTVTNSIRMTNIIRELFPQTSKNWISPHVVSKVQRRLRSISKMYFPTFYAFYDLITEYETEPLFRELIRSYNVLLTGNFEQPQLETHAAILKSFADNGYQYAQELSLTYQIFHTFAGFQHLQEIAQADQALSEILKISYGDLLHAQLVEMLNALAEMSNDLKNYDVVENYRDKQYFLSEARIKLYEISRKAQDELYEPERGVLLKIIEQWQGVITTEAKKLRGPAELQVSILNKNLTALQEWNPVTVLIKNIGQSPAENVRVALLENETLTAQEKQKTFGLLGTGEAKQIEFSVKLQDNPAELRMYFDVTFDDFERKNKHRPFADIVSLSMVTEEFKKIPNPFVAGTPVRSEKVFFGRKETLDFAIDNLRGGTQNNVLIFFGQRRVGKSSFLYRLMNSPLTEDYLFAYIDCQGFGEVDTAKLLYQICNKLYDALKKAQLVIVKPDLKSFQEQLFAAFDMYLDTVEAALDQKQLALLFDEYEFLEYKVKAGQVSPELFNKLRNLMQHRRKLAFIFAGTHRLTELTEDYWSILFNIALYHEIGPLDRESATALMTEPVQGYLRYDELAIDKLLRVTGQHPYFIQVACRLLVNYCNQQQTNFVTLATVNNVLKEAVEGSTAHVKYLFKDYAAKPEQEIMVFLAKVTDDGKHFASVSEIVRMAKENGFTYDRKYIMETLASLKNKKLLKEGGEIRGEIYGFEVDLLRLWIAEHVTIQRGFINLI